MDPLVAIAFLATLMLSAPAALLPLMAALRPRRTWALRLLVASLGIGPIVLSFLLTATMTLAPGHSPGIYVVCVLIGLAALAYLGWHERQRALAALRYFSVAISRCDYRSSIHWLGMLTAAFLMASLLGLAIAIPLDENDALEYAGSARHIYEQRSALNYPFVDSSKTNGYYGPWSHALGYISLQVWGFLVQGHATDAGVIKLISPYFALCSALLVWVWLGGARRVWAIWGAVLLLSTPLYYFNATANQIDAIRLFAYFCAGMFLPLVWNSHRLTALTAYGVLVGFALYTHSIGLLAVPTVALVLLLKSPYPWRTRLWQAAIVCSVAILLVSYRLIDNVIVFGSPIADVGAVPVYRVPALDWEGYFRESRDLGTPVERVLYGLFAGITRPTVYGLSYWLLALAVLIYVRRYRLPSSARALAGGFWSWLTTARRSIDVAALILTIFAGMVLTSMLLGMDAFIKNIRYLLTVQPYVALFAAGVIGPAVITASKEISGRKPRFVRLTLVTGFAAACVAIPSYYAYAKLKVFDLIGPQILDSDTRKRDISKAGYVKVPAYTSRHLPADARILTFQQAQLAFYGRHPYLSDIDPRLLPFYQITDVGAAHAELARLGITHLLLPGYPIPTVYNSAVDRLIADPNRSELVFELDGNRLYRLKSRTENPRPANSKELTSIPLTDEAGRLEWTAWSRELDYFIPQQLDPDLRMLRVEQQPLVSLKRPETRLQSGRGPIELSPGQGSSMVVPIVKCGYVHRLSLEAAGEGWMDVNVLLYPGDAPPEWKRVWNGLLNAKPRRIDAMFDALWTPRPGKRCDLAEMRVVARLSGRGAMGIRNVSLERTEHRGANQADQQRIVAQESGWRIVEREESNALDWGMRSGAEGHEVFINQADRRRVSLRSAAYKMPAGATSMELETSTSGQGMFAVRFVCQVHPEEGASAWFLMWLNKLQALPKTHTLTGGGDAFAGPRPVPRVWRGDARHCEQAFVQIYLLHSSFHRGMPDEYARLVLRNPVIRANLEDGQSIVLKNNTADAANATAIKQ